ncbi:MAG: hypothetical protein PUF22_04010 [Clostridium sp.]|nr:hypothetical protein [Clostridium sp.]
MNGSIINFVETPKEVSVDISSKKAKLSSRSFALIKKAASKIRESLAQKMEAQKVELAKQYQEAHETVREEAQNQNTKNRNEYDGDRLQRLTNALGSIGVKLILSDYAASRLSVYGQPKAIKMPNFWSNIKDTLSNAHMVDREYKDIGRAFKYGGSERGIEGLDSMYKMMNESKNIQNPEKREAPVQEPVQPKVPEQPKSGINIDDYLKNFDPQQPSIEATNKEVDARLAETEAGINDRFSQMMSNLGRNEHEQVIQPVETPQIEKPVNQAFIPSEAKKEEPNRSELNAKVANVFEGLLEKRVKDEAKASNSEPVTTSTTATTNKSEENLDREALMQDLINRYGINQSVASTQKADTKVSTQPSIQYRNSTIGEIYTSEPKPEVQEVTKNKTSDDSKEETREEMIKRIYVEQTMKEFDEKMKAQAEAKKYNDLANSLEEKVKQLEEQLANQGLSQNNPNFGGVVSPRKR